MRKLIGRAGPLLIFAPSRDGGSREPEALVPAPPAEGAGPRMTPIDRTAPAPTLAEKLEQVVAGALGRRRRVPSPAGAAVEDLWDPAGVPGPLEIAIESRAQRVAWWLWAGGRR